MAVVQISKIQVRRGKKNTSGMPQLASGELAWAIDTQELYIGNGAVGEGAPAVGNTKVLTEHDNIIDLLNQYSYKPTDNTIVTGLPGPTERTLQQRLDEGAVNAKSFGIDGSDSTVDQTALIQNAIWSLYDRVNPATNRVNLEFDPGTYKITGTIYIPRNMGIIGSGSGRTEFVFVKGGINTGTTLTLSGTSITTAGTYNNVATSTVTGSGSGAIVNVTKTGTGTSYTSGNTTITIVNSGSGYANGDQIKISGAALGGANGTNDLTITLTNTKTLATEYPTFAVSKAFEFVGSNSTRDTRDQNVNSPGESGPSNIILRSFKLATKFTDYVMGFDLRSVINSQFEDIDCVALQDNGNEIVIPQSVNNLGSVAFNLVAVSSALSNTTREVKFKNIKARGYSYGVYSNTDILNNVFDGCLFECLYQGVSFGVGAGSSSNGPCRNTITNSVFREIAREAFVVAKGYGNRSRGNTFIRVGQSGTLTNFSILRFDVPGNSSIQDNFDRNEFARTATSNRYHPEIEGYGLLHETMPATVTINGLTTSPATAFKLPLNDAVGIEVRYVWRSDSLSQMRKGTLHIAVDRDRSDTQVVDEYEYVGTTGDDTKLSFTASINQDPSTGVRVIAVEYTNTNPVGTSTFSYTYSILS